MKVIDKMISKRGFINFDERTNSIIVRDLESNLELISGVIKSLDTITPEVMIETKIIETDLNNTDNLGIDWVLQASISGAQEPTIFPFTHKRRNFWKRGAGSFFPAANIDFIQPLTPRLRLQQATRGFTYGTINATQLSATLQLLSTRSTTKILSNPRIVTLDNQKAKFNVGLQYPEAKYSFNTSTGQQQVNRIYSLPIGINFEVTPHVNNAGLITLDLHPQISAFKGTISVDNNHCPKRLIKRLRPM